MKKSWCLSAFELGLPIIFGIICHFWVEQIDWYIGVIFGFLCSILIALICSDNGIRSNFDKLASKDRVLGEKISVLSQRMEDLEKILMTSQKIETNDIPYFKRIISDRYLKFLDDNASLFEGYNITHPYKNETFGINGIKTTTLSLDAVSAAIQDYWDRKEFVSQFMQVQEELIKNRNVRIRRIFIGTKEFLSTMENTMREQHKIGIKVYCIASNSEYFVPEWQNEDFLIQDNRLVVFFDGLQSHRADASGNEIISIRPADVAKKRDLYAILLNNATPFEEYFRRRCHK